VSEGVQTNSFSFPLPRWNHLLGVLIFFSSIIGLLFLNEHGFLGSKAHLLSPFLIKEVKVMSDWPLTVSEVKSWLPNLEGKSLISVNAKELVLSMEQRPWIAHAMVKKQYPDRLWIEVETKRPRALSVIKGTSYFIDAKGLVIEKARPRILKTLDLPFISMTADPDKWDVSRILGVTEQFKMLFKSKYSLSQVILGNYPYFKMFLDNPKLELVLNIENWESQSKILETLLVDPPSQMEQLQRINLIFPKKAVVSIHN
jgi:cell division septal protein FtsQ